MTPPKPIDILRETFGLEAFRPGQKEVMSALWKDKAALAVFPTGGGKSLCYQLPALMFEGVTLVVSPLIALMKDQIDYLKSRGIAAERLDSTLQSREAQEVIERAKRGELKLLYVAPERFTNERFLRSLRSIKIALFAVDEAHCISAWGHNFRPDYLKLAEAARNAGAERVLALTATATPAVVKDICTEMHIPDHAAIVTGFYRSNLHLFTSPVRAAERDDLLLTRMKSRKPGPTIIYVTLQRTAERLAVWLTENGSPASAYHAGMETEARTSVQNAWMASDTGIVVATIAFGMGIDKANVRFVYHYNLPKGLESYTQEMGRAGRDGETSIVELFACQSDVPVLENFVYGDTPTEGAIRELIQAVLAGAPEYHANLYSLSSDLDLRILVLRTALTYLELLGIITQGTPFYAGYELRPRVSREHTLAAFTGEPQRFLRSIFDGSRQINRNIGVCFSVNPDEAAARLGCERRRIVRALEVLEEQGLAAVVAADIRYRYIVEKPDANVGRLVLELMTRFLKRETQETARIREVLKLVVSDGCQSNYLAAHFGEVRGTGCGHCTFCITRAPQVMPDQSKPAALPGHLDVNGFDRLRKAYPTALGTTRQSARFLCGLTSPAVTKARISKDAMFGALDRYGFLEVMEWLEKL